MARPIQSKEEARQVRAYLIKETMSKTGCSKPQAIKRINRLFDSGILESGNPEDPKTQFLIDQVLTTPV